MVASIPNMILAWLVPAFPLLGFLITGLGYKRLKHNQAGIIASTMVALSFLMTVVLYFTLKNSGQDSATVTLFNWISVGKMNIPFAFLIDHLSLTMMLIITGVGCLIHIYSIGYMHDDDRVNSFFAQMNLFTFSMLLLVMGANYLILFIGWEGVGLCSYLLIGFWFKNPTFNYAARKAFVMNRIGDLGFILGIILLFFTYNSVSFSEIFVNKNNFSVDPVITIITLLLLVGAVGKSAQIPLFTWLPDAMAGPTPVSALIHAATMVTAGIYMIARSSILFNQAPITLAVITILGLSTAILGAVIGLKQNDIKKVLAYSTVSQLGYMFIALGIGAYSTAVFHVTTHAFFKALLFLGAGSIIHALGGEQDIRKMGGLRTKLPVTYWTFLAATLAISGIPPFSGFFSKDLILSKAFEHNTLLYILALGGALLTTFYMFRLFYLVFFGEERVTGLHPHESPKVMTVPLMILAFLSVFGGFLNVPSLFGGDSKFIAFLESAVTTISGEKLGHGTEIGLIVFSSLLIGLVILFAYRIFVRNGQVPKRDSETMSFTGRLITNKFYLDELYILAFEKPFRLLSDFLFKQIETKVLNPAVEGIGAATLRLGGLVRKIQRGNISFYFFAMIAGILLFIIFILTI